jgi:hypothetical protein
MNTEIDPSKTVYMGHGKTIYFFYATAIDDEFTLECTCPRVVYGWKLLRSGMCSDCPKHGLHGRITAIRNEAYFGGLPNA